MRPFYTCSVLSGGQQHRIVVWDGIRDFQRRPPNKLIEQLQGETTIARINKPITGERSAIDAIDFFTESYDCVVLWARNHNVFQSIVDELEWSSLTVDGKTLRVCNNVGGKNDRQKEPLGDRAGSPRGGAVR